MTDDEVIAALEPHVAPEALEQFVSLQMNYEVTNGNLDTDRVLYAPVACPDGRFMAASFRLEPGEDEDGLFWETVWHQVQGPMTLDELKALGNA